MCQYNAHQETEGDEIPRNQQRQSQGTTSHEEADLSPGLAL